MTENTRKFVGCDPDKCTGCGVCEYICSLEKERAFNPIKSRIRNVRLHLLANVSVACRLCEDPLCVNACPQKALEQSNASGVILVNEDRCIGCGWCIQACEFGAISFHPKKRTVVVCDLCDGDPKCVKWCPEEALQLTPHDTKALETPISIIFKSSRGWKAGG